MSASCYKLNNDTNSFYSKGVTANDSNFQDYVTGPIILNCPSNIYKSAEVGMTNFTVSWLEPSALDLHGSASLVHASHRPGTSFSFDATTHVSYVFADDFDNQAYCNFSVTVDQGNVLIYTIHKLYSFYFHKI